MGFSVNETEICKKFSTFSDMNFGECLEMCTFAQERILTYFYLILFPKQYSAK